MQFRVHPVRLPIRVSPPSAQHTFPTNENTQAIGYSIALKSLLHPFRWSLNRS